MFFIFAQGSNETLKIPLITQDNTIKLLQSASWRVTRPVRIVLNYLNQNYGIPIGNDRLFEDDINFENPPPEIAIRVLASYSWQLLAPFRLILLIAKRIYSWPRRILLKRRNREEESNN